jgi:tRNA(Ile)-lysidine synthetase-like protein
LLEKEFNPKAVEHVRMLAHLALEDEMFLAALAREKCDELAPVEGKGRKIECGGLLSPTRTRRSNADATGMSKQSSKALSARMVRILAGEFKAAGSELSAAHVEAVLQLAEHGENGKVLQLPGRVDVRREDDTLVFLPRVAARKKGEKSFEFSYPVQLSNGETKIAVQEIGCVLRFRSIDWHSAQRETIGKGSAALDREKLQGVMVLRNLQPGDRMRPEGHRGTHKLKRLLNERRISRWEREGWPVLESGKNIVWARGFVAAEYAATSTTQKAILVSEEKA